MSKQRTLLAIASAAALAVVVLAVASPSSADGGLQAQVSALAERVGALEKELASLRTSVRAIHPDPADEQKAVAEYQAMNALMMQGDMAGAKTKLAALLQEYGNTRAGQQASGFARELAVIGSPAPESWGIEEWYQGQSDIDLSADGPTLLVFWETWCPHCQREVPKLQQLYERNRGRGLQVIGVSRQTRGATGDSVRQFIDQHDLDFPFVKEDGSLSAHFGVDGIPAAAVVKDGEIVWRGHPARLPANAVEQWLR